MKTILKTKQLSILLIALSLLITQTSYADWIHCASEGQFCSFEGSKKVKYGAKNSWVELNFSNGVSCSNNIFGDPIEGIGKDCYYYDPEWIHCAKEGEYCSFKGLKEVKYGANSSWVHKEYIDGVSCSNNIFGDPIVGVGKNCYYRNNDNYWDGHTWGGPWYTPLIGDVDGDGRADRVVYHRKSGDWGCWLTGGHKCNWDTHDWGGTGYLPLLGDINGDGKDDRVVYHKVTGDWGCWLTDGYKCSWDTHDWGGEGYEPLLKDVNGDGKVDRVVYRKSDGNWGVRITP